MQRTFKTIATVSMLGTLMACAQLGSPPDAVPVRLAGPVLPPELPLAQATYLQGRSAQGLGQSVQASVYYEQVLWLEPMHGGALNALGVIHAQEGRTDEALALFARAIALTPAAPHLYNNAGYALLRADRMDEARVQLQRAQQLNPASLQTQHNLALLAQATRKAAVTPAEDTVVDLFTSGARLVAVAPQIYELQMSAPWPAVQLAKAVQTVPVLAQRQPAGEKLAEKRVSMVNLAQLPPAAGVRDTPRSARLELANSAGITRLSQTWPYRQMKTESQLGAGWKALAKAQPTPSPLATATATTTATARRPGDARDAQLRLVLAPALPYGPRPKSGRAT